MHQTCVKTRAALGTRTQPTVRTSRSVTSRTLPVRSARSRRSSSNPLLKKSASSEPSPPSSGATRRRSVLSTGMSSGTLVHLHSQKASSPSAPRSTTSISSSWGVCRFVPHHVPREVLLDLLPLDVRPDPRPRRVARGRLHHRVAARQRARPLE